eukprot:1160802-Pelagomonas_calceolata.AAC.6
MTKSNPTIRGAHTLCGNPASVPKQGSLKKGNKRKKGKTVRQQSGLPEQGSREKETRDKGKKRWALKHAPKQGSWQCWHERAAAPATLTKPAQENATEP